ncbi:MAG: hypothetical protein JSS11_05305 [Verrucomicrobia bacterium]|nr:hypothetical protein [Verrucomicrobiota bacterium]
MTVSFRGLRGLVLTLALLGASLAQVRAQTTLLAGWDFTTTTNGGTSAATTPLPSAFAANFGTQAGTAGIYVDAPMAPRFSPARKNGRPAA